MTASTSARIRSTCSRCCTAAESWSGRSTRTSPRNWASASGALQRPPTQPSRDAQPVDETRRAVAPAARDGRGRGGPTYARLRDRHPGERVEQLSTCRCRWRPRWRRRCAVPRACAAPRPRPEPVRPRRASCCPAGYGTAPPAPAARRAATAGGPSYASGVTGCAAEALDSDGRTRSAALVSVTRRAMSPSSQRIAGFRTSGGITGRPPRPNGRARARGRRSRPWNAARRSAGPREAAARSRASLCSERRPSALPDGLPSRVLRTLLLQQWPPRGRRSPSHRRHGSPSTFSSPFLSPVLSPVSSSRLSGTSSPVVIRVVSDGGHGGHLSFCSTDRAAMSSAWGSGCTSSASSGARRRSRSVSQGPVEVLGEQPSAPVAQPQRAVRPDPFGEPLARRTGPAGRPAGRWRPGRPPPRRPARRSGRGRAPLPRRTPPGRAASVVRPSRSGARRSPAWHHGPSVPAAPGGGFAAPGLVDALVGGGDGAQQQGAEALDEGVEQFAGGAVERDRLRHRLSASPGEHGPGLQPPLHARVLAVVRPVDGRGEPQGGGVLRGRRARPARASGTSASREPRAPYGPRPRAGHAGSCA